MSSPPTSQIRSIYRSLLRELPSRPKHTPASPLRVSIRQHFFASPPTNAALRTQEAEQFVHYLKAQRMYNTLIERYNPGTGMLEEERVRLTARRVGMDMPPEWYGSVKKPA